MNDDELEHACPRCGATVRQRYYGPCPDCRSDLAARMSRDQRDVEAPAYEPKVNVTANAVALRADD
jgi:hypothetical protein